jgi:hypothetical protein
MLAIDFDVAGNDCDIGFGLGGREGERVLLA